MSYAGQVETIPYGALGLLTDLSPIDIPPNALIRADNIVLTNGTVQKAPGARKFNANPLPAGILAFKDWFPSKSVQRMIVACSNGNLYRDNGYGTFSFNGGAPLNEAPLTGLNPNCQFVSAGNETAGREQKLFFFSRGQNQIQVLSGDGGEFTPIASPATDWVSSNFPLCGALHRNHLFVFAGQRAYGSNTGNHEDFASGDFITQPVFPGEGGDILAAFVYKGRLFCWKEGRFGYWLDDSNPDADLWVWRKITSNFGLSGTNAILEVLNDLIAGNDTGTVTSYTASDTLGDVDAGDIIQNAQIENYLRGNSSKAGLDVQHAIYYSEKKQVFFTYRSGYYTYNNMLLVIDVSKINQPRITFWKKGIPQCLGLWRDNTNINRPAYGSSDGHLYIMDYEDRLEGSAAYRGEFQTPHLALGTAKNKSFDNLTVHYRPESKANLMCAYYIDGKYIETISFPMAQYEGPLLDELLLDTDRLAEPTTESFTRPLTGSGRTISFKFWNEGSNESFQVSALSVGFRPTGDQAQDNNDGGGGD